MNQKRIRIFSVVGRNGSRSVESDLTEREAAEIILNNKPSDFGMSLCRQLTTSGLSSKQLAWLHILAYDARERLREQERQASAIGNEIVPLTRDGEEGFEAIPALFRKGGEKLKFPKIRLAVVSGGEILNQYILFVMGERSRSPGSIMVCQQSEDYHGERCGRIAPDGIWVPNSVGVDERHPGLLDLLRRFAGDPAGVTAELGRLIGKCCYCGLTLSDERSTEMGYGPICAASWGLDWGNKRREKEEPKQESVEDIVRRLFRGHQTGV